MLAEATVKNLAADTRAARRIEHVSVAWTSIEALAGIIAGVMAGSVALICFGADSIIEVASSAILLWRLSDQKLGEQRERTAHKLVGGGFATEFHLCLSRGDFSRRTCA